MLFYDMAPPKKYCGKLIMRMTDQASDSWLLIMSDLQGHRASSTLGDDRNQYGNISKYVILFGPCPKHPH